MTENIDNYILSDEELEQVVGGAKRTVHNDESSYTLIFDGPNGKEVGRVYNGDKVYTTGYYKYSDGYDWYELDDGTFIQGNYIGY